MSSPRWERAEVDNLETISQTKKKRGEKIPNNTRTVREKNKKKFRTPGQQQQQQLKKQKNVGGIDIPGFGKNNRK
jgi:hypothetical protein